MRTYDSPFGFAERNPEATTRTGATLRRRIGEDRELVFRPARAGAAQRRLRRR